MSLPIFILGGGAVYSRKLTETKTVGLCMQQAPQWEAGKDSFCSNKMFLSPNILTQSEQSYLAALSGYTNSAPILSDTHAHPGHNPYTPSAIYPQPPSLPTGWVK